MEKRFKYPRTPHLPWSRCVQRDDILIYDLSVLRRGQIVVTEKRDGECTTMYPDGLHARSLDSGHHPSRSWVKNLWASICTQIPAGWRVCGENLYAKHSIGYGALESYFEVFSVWDNRNRCLSWPDTVVWALERGLSTVPVLYEGPWDESAIRDCWNSSLHETREGYVVRSVVGFNYDDFESHVAKFVRPNHVTTASHWRNAAVQLNGLTT